VTLSLEATSDLCLTLPFEVVFTLHLHKVPDNYSFHSLLLDWNPWRTLYSGELLLLRDASDGFEIVDVANATTQSKLDMISADDEQIFCHAKPRETIQRHYELPETYYHAMKPNERYALLWPGGSITWWDYGITESKQGPTIESKETVSRLPHSLILPASNALYFKTYEASPPWLDLQGVEEDEGFSEVSRSERHWKKHQEIHKPERFPHVHTKVSSRWAGSALEA
jgi:hypothetical protein